MPSSPADRVRASKLRRRMAAGDELEDDDSAWFASYEAAKHSNKSMEAPSGSASERITYTEERSAATGDHPHPEAYASAARAEGLRADTLLRIAADALVRSNEQFQVMNAHLLERTVAIEQSHVAMLETIREHYIGRIEAEGEAAKQRHVAESIAAASAESGGDFGQLLQYLMQAMAMRKEADEERPKNSKKKPKKSKTPLGTIE